MSHCAAGCTTRHQHLTTCPGDCDGCQPRPAADGAHVCHSCWTRTLAGIRELPSLWHDLLTPTKAAGRSQRVTGSTERPQPLSDAPRAARSAISAVLTAWAWTLHDDRHLQLPADTVHAKGRHLATHAPWLLNHPDHAEQLVHDIRVVVSDARRAAYPSRPDGVTLGTCPLNDDGQTCGGTLRYRDGQQAIICPRCGAAGTVDQWQNAVHATEPTHAATGAAIAAWLSRQHYRVITEGTIRHWAHRGLITRDGKDPQGRTLYSVTAATETAARIYGHPLQPVA